MVVWDKDQLVDTYSNTVVSGDREIWFLLSSNESFSNNMRFYEYLYYCEYRQWDEIGAIETS